MDGGTSKVTVALRRLPILSVAIADERGEPLCAAGRIAAGLSGGIWIGGPVIDHGARRLRFEVRGPDGRVVAEPDVVWQEMGRALTLPLPSDLPEDAELVATLFGAAVARAAIRPGEVLELRVPRDRLCVLLGRVRMQLVDAAGRPARGAVAGWIRGVVLGSAEAFEIDERLAGAMPGGSGDIASEHVLPGIYDWEWTEIATGAFGVARQVVVSPDALTDVGQVILEVGGRLRVETPSAGPDLVGMRVRLWRVEPGEYLVPNTGLSAGGDLLGIAGNTLEWSGIPPGTYRVEVRAAGFVPYFEEIAIRAGGEAECLAVLRRGTAREFELLLEAPPLGEIALALFAPPGAEDQRLVDQTPAHYDAGARKARARLYVDPGLYDAEWSVSGESLLRAPGLAVGR